MRSNPKPPPNGKPDLDPRLFRHAATIVKDEWQAVLSLVRFQWLLVLAAIVGMAAVVYLTEPLPPRTIRLATGQPDSSLDLLGRKFKSNFSQHGVGIELVNTAGALENVELLRKGKVDAAFSLGGMVQADRSKIVSLGSVEYQPLWFFYRGQTLEGANPADFFKIRTLSINIPGSGTRSMSEKILALHGIEIDGNPRVVSLSSTQSVAALRDGKIDGMFLVAGIESGTIKRLLAEPAIRVLDLNHAESYRRKMRFLEPITLPRGSLDAVQDSPPQPKQLVATTTTILTTEALHPSMQQLLLATARRIDQEGHDFFMRPGGFPARIDNDVPLSKVAERYYEKGPPLLHGYVPFWIASFFAEIGIIGFWLALIGYPLFKIVPKARIFYATICMNDLYYELRILDRKVKTACTSAEMAGLSDQLDHIEQKARQLWVPVGAHEYFYKLRLAIDVVRVDFDQRLKGLKTLRPSQEHLITVP